MFWPMVWYVPTEDPLALRGDPMVAWVGTLFWFVGIHVRLYWASLGVFCGTGVLFFSCAIFVWCEQQAHVLGY